MFTCHFHHFYLSLRLRASSSYYQRVSQLECAAINRRLFPMSSPPHSFCLGSRTWFLQLFLVPGGTRIRLGDYIQCVMIQRRLISHLCRMYSVYSVPTQRIRFVAIFREYNQFPDNTAVEGLEPAIEAIQRSIGNQDGSMIAKMKVGN